MKTVDKFTKVNDKEKVSNIKRLYVGITKDDEIYSIEVRDKKGVNYFSISGSTDRKITESEAEEQSREMLIDNFEDGQFDPDYISSDAIDTDWFQDALEESNRFYAEDIYDEGSDDYPNRLAEEMVDRGIVDEEEAKDDEFEAMDYIDDFVEDLSSDYDDPTEWFIDNFGKEEYNRTLVEKNLIDVEAVVDDMDVMEYFDNSTLPEEVVGDDGETYLFEASGGGQNIDELNNLAVSFLPFSLLAQVKRNWSKYHLKELPKKDFFPKVTQDEEAILKYYVNNDLDSYAKGGDVKVGDIVYPDTLSGKWKVIKLLGDKKSNRGITFMGGDYYETQIQSLDTGEIVNYPSNRYAKGGKIDDKLFDKIYKKYRAKNYFGLDDRIKNKIKELKSFQRKGDKNALKYNEDDVKNYFEEENYKRSYENTYKPLVNAIKNKDKDFLKNRVRYNQKFTKEIFEKYTGNKLPNTNVALAKYFDKNYAKGGDVPKGFHKKLDGTIMKDSEHMAKGGYIPYEDVREFEVYVSSFYGKDGIYKDDYDGGFTEQEIIEAVSDYIKDPRTEWGGGDSFDRELVRDRYLIPSRYPNRKTEFKEKGGKMEKVKVISEVYSSNGNTYNIDEYRKLSNEELIGKKQLSLTEAKNLLFKINEDAIDYEDEINELESVDELGDFVYENDLGTIENTYNYSWWGGTRQYIMVHNDGDRYDADYETMVFMSYHRGGDVRGNYEKYEAFEIDGYAYEEFPIFSDRLTYTIQKDGKSITADTEDMEGYNLYIQQSDFDEFEEDDTTNLDELGEKLGFEAYEYYEAGGTLPTPFGQAGLVGETGTLNEMELFAMGGTLPQGVHQYYANTYNPAYPTPHGYAKGGEIGVGSVVANKKHKTIGIVRDYYEKYGDARTDADGMVNISDLEAYNPKKHKNYKIAPSTKDEIESAEMDYAKGGDVKELKQISKELAKSVKAHDRQSKELKKIASSLVEEGKMAKGGYVDIIKVTEPRSGKRTEKQVSRKDTYREALKEVDRLNAKNKNPDVKFVTGNIFAKGGKTQGFNDKLDESLGNTKGKRSTKEQNYKDRRDESEAMEKKDGRRKYARVKTMDKGNRKKRKTPMTLAKAIRRDGEKWQDALKRAVAMMKKDA